MFSSAYLYKEKKKSNEIMKVIFYPVGEIWESLSTACGLDFVMLLV